MNIVCVDGWTQNTHQVPRQQRIYHSVITGKHFAIITSNVQLDNKQVWCSVAGTELIPSGGRMTLTKCKQKQSSFHK